MQQCASICKQVTLYSSSSSLALRVSFAMPDDNRFAIFCPSTQIYEMCITVMHINQQS